MYTRLFLSGCLLAAALPLAAAPLNVDAWPEAMAAFREKAQETDDLQPLIEDLYRRFPLATDWFYQDARGAEGLKTWARERPSARFENALLNRVIRALPHPKSWRTKRDVLEDKETPAGDAAWLELYTELCLARRTQRLAPLRATWPELIFTKHYLLGGSHYAYTEGQSDAQNERTFIPGGGLYRLNTRSGEVTPLIEDPEGVIRDPDISQDGERILFSWKKSDREDDFHLYEYTLATGKTRQLTFGLGFADYEGVYLPNGDILFNSTRCVQTVDCWLTEVSNLYACDPDGGHIRRVTFDQVHTNYPTVTEDGRVLYTRWDYNDRGQIYPQPLMRMNTDGTGQMEYYGGNSYFPTTIIHARDIPDSPKVLAILTGHHTHQRGKLAWIDVRKGRQEAQGVQLIAPIRPTTADRVDRYGQDGEQFQYPYPLDEHHFLVTFSPHDLGTHKRPEVPYGVFFMNADGKRELLAADSQLSCSQAIPLTPRSLPHARPQLVDYAQKEGAYFIQDIYEGPGLAGVERGSITRLRVVALDFRAAAVGDNRNGGPAGGALVSTPVAAGNGTWDVKRVLGETPVHADGSAFFTVPARTPLYFQAIDRQGHAAQTMRSWSTLQPGEALSCVGCHENKSAAPAAVGKEAQAMKFGPQPLRPFYGPTRGFSYPKEIQPIWDKHCIACHHDADRPAKPTSAPAPVAAQPLQPAFSLTGDPVHDRYAKRHWSQSYLNLLQAEAKYGDKEHGYVGQSNPWINWIGSQSVPSLLPPYSGGAAKSGLMTLLENGHAGVRLSQEELEKIACWIDLFVPYCGDYEEAAAWNKTEQEKYTHFLTKRKNMEAEEAQSLLALRQQKGTP